jgi:hypothetical protein
MVKKSTQLCHSKNSNERQVKDIIVSKILVYYDLESYRRMVWYDINGKLVEDTIFDDTRRILNPRTLEFTVTRTNCKNGYFTIVLHSSLKIIELKNEEISLDNVSFTEIIDDGEEDPMGLTFYTDETKYTATRFEVM